MTECPSVCTCGIKVVVKNTRRHLQAAGSADILFKQSDMKTFKDLHPHGRVSCFRVGSRAPEQRDDECGCVQSEGLALPGVGVGPPPRRHAGGPGRGRGRGEPAGVQPAPLLLLLLELLAAAAAPAGSQAQCVSCVYILVENISDSLHSVILSSLRIQSLDILTWIGSKFRECCYHHLAHFKVLSRQNIFKYRHKIIIDPIMSSILALPCPLSR